jgi:hypothetical protein
MTSSPRAMASMASVMEWGKRFSGRRKALLAHM